MNEIREVIKFKLLKVRDVVMNFKGVKPQFVQKMHSLEAKVDSADVLKQ